MDKYEDALYQLADGYYEIDIDYDYDDNLITNYLHAYPIELVDTLQELIENHKQLKKAYEKACTELARKERVLSSMRATSSLPLDKCWTKEEWMEELIKNG